MIIVIGNIISRVYCSYQEVKPRENTCNKHRFKCNICGDCANYIFNDRYYCLDCLLNKFNCESSTTTHYFLDGEYLGSDDDIDKVIFALDDGISEID